MIKYMAFGMLHHSLVHVHNLGLLSLSGIDFRVKQASVLHSLNVMFGTFTEHNFVNIALYNYNKQRFVTYAQILI